MKKDDLALAITNTLWRFMRTFGHGTIKWIEETMGVPMDALRTAKNGRFGLRVRHVTGAIKAMGIPPTVFFNEALGGGVKTTAEERFIARGALLAARKVVDLPVMAEETKPDRLTEEDLERLDAARFEDPRAAAEQAAGVARLAARDGRRGDAAAAVARQGSALRVAEEWEQAWVCVWWAMANAPDGRVRADALRRCASVVSDFGQFEDAANLAIMAGTEYMKSGDVQGVGRALLGCGIFLRYAGHLEQALSRLAAAPAFLPESDRLSHFAIHQNIGLAFVDLDDPDAAERHAIEASAIDQVPAPLKTTLGWFKARIAATKRDHPVAIQLYSETIDALEHSPGNAALASAELCRVLLVSGRSKEAVQRALLMVKLTSPRSQNCVVAAAIVDLYRSAARGVLSVDLVERTIARMRDGLRRRAISDTTPAASSS